MKTTYKQLLDKCEELNKALQMPSNQEFRIYSAYGKYQLVKKCGQGEENVSFMGTKNEIYEQISVMIYVARMPNVQIGTLAQLESKIIKQENENTIKQTVKTL